MRVFPDDQTNFISYGKGSLPGPAFGYGFDCGNEYGNGYGDAFSCGFGNGFRNGYNQFENTHNYPFELVQYWS